MFSVLNNVLTQIRGKGLGREESGIKDCIQLRKREDNLGVKSIIILVSNPSSSDSILARSFDGTIAGGKTLTTMPLQVST